MTWVAIIGGAFLALIIWGRAHGSRIRKEKADGSYARQFIHVNEDGTARELSPDETEYLNTEFRGADGGRPYIKRRYQQRTSDGKIWGYLPRRKLPRGTRVDAN
jgi:hypothetical protein